MIAVCVRQSPLFDGGTPHYVIALLAILPHHSADVVLFDGRTSCGRQINVREQWVKFGKNSASCRAHPWDLSTCTISVSFEWYLEGISKDILAFTQSAQHYPYCLRLALSGSVGLQVLIFITCGSWRTVYILRPSPEWCIGLQVPLPMAYL
jgi:hypothetical protein